MIKCSLSGLKNVATYSILSETETPPLMLEPKYLRTDARQNTV